MFETVFSLSFRQSRVIRKPLRVDSGPPFVMENLKFQQHCEPETLKHLLNGIQRGAALRECLDGVCDNALVDHRTAAAQPSVRVLSRPLRRWFGGCNVPHIL